MAKLYFDLINQGKRTLDQVPINWREEVKKMLEENK